MRQPRLHIDSFGNKFYELDGDPHCTDGPALDYTYGHQEWYEFGRRHRTDGPAVIFADGGMEWWIEGRRHRTDGPAIVQPYRKSWWIDGKEVDPLVAFIANKA